MGHFINCILGYMVITTSSKFYYNRKDTVKLYKRLKELDISINIKLRKSELSSKSDKRAVITATIKMSGKY